MCSKCKLSYCNVRGTYYYLLPYESANSMSPLSSGQKRDWKSGPPQSMLKHVRIWPRCVLNLMEKYSRASETACEWVFGHRNNNRDGPAPPYLRTLPLVFNTRKRLTLSPSSSRRRTTDGEVGLECERTTKARVLAALDLEMASETGKICRNSSKLCFM